MEPELLHPRSAPIRIESTELLRDSAQSTQTARPAYTKSATVRVDEVAELSDTVQLSRAQRSRQKFGFRQSKRYR